MSKPAPLGDHLEDAVSDEDLARTWQSLRGARASRARRKMYARAGVIALGVAATLAIGYRFYDREETAPPREASVPEPARFDYASSERGVRFTDRSSIATGDRSRVEVVESTPDATTVQLVRGRAWFEITPHTGRTWTVRAADVEVEVVGTVFVVDRQDARVIVRVDRGVVIVRAPTIATTRLRAGERLVVPLERPVEVVQAPVDEVIAPPPRRVAPSARELLAEADRARAEGREEDAIRTLAAIADDHPRSSEAPLAAFTAARLLDRSGRSEEARRWYARALDLGVPEPLAERAREALETP